MLHDAVLAAAPALVVAALILGPISAWLAARQQRNPAIWLLFGAVIGPIALAILVLAPPARCPSCAEPTAGFATRCAACGTDLDSKAPGPADLMAWTDGAVPNGAGGSVPGDASGGRRLRSLPDASTGSDGGPGRITGARDEMPGDGQPARLSAVGARRPSGAATIGGSIIDGSRLDVTLLAMAVLVLGPEPLQSGSRYVIARSRDRLLVIGPVEASNEHVEYSLPLLGVEANYIADRLVVSATGDDRNRSSIVIAFQSVASLTGRAVDEAIMEPAAPLSIVVGRP
jgi:hypothetical protein